MQDVLPLSMIIYHVNERSVCSGVIQVGKTQFLPLAALCVSDMKQCLSYTCAFSRTEIFTKYYVVFIKTKQFVCMVSVSLVVLDRGLYFILFRRGHVAK